MAKNNIVGLSFNFSKDITEQADYEELMAKCEEFGKSQYTESGRKIGYDSSNRMCSCCTASMLCLALSYKLNLEDKITRTKTAFNMNHFYSEYSGEALDSLFYKVIETIKKYTERGETVKEEKLLNYLKEQVTSDEIKSETVVFAEDVLNRVISDPRIVKVGNELSYAK